MTAAVSLGALTLVLHVNSAEAAPDVVPRTQVGFGSRPHAQTFDPETGGPVTIPGVRHLLQAAGELAPLHADPMPAGTSLSDPTDTESLLTRAEAAAPAARARRPFSAGATAPLGTPGVASLTQHVVPSCSGTGTDGNRVQVLYVREARTASRFAAVLPVLRNEVATVDDVFAVSAEQTGGDRRVRWVHDAACFPVVKEVVVPNGALDDFGATMAAMEKLGYDKPSRKYLMFADANKLCGIATLYDDPKLTRNFNDGLYTSYARVDTTCWTASHSVAAHELTHTLGGVQRAAPHATASGHCFDESDLMCYDDGSGKVMRQVCPSAQEQLLDCNHDDYFSTSPAPGSFLARSWNTASSSFLDRVTTPAGPGVTVTPSRTRAATGDPVGLTAALRGAPVISTVTWSWSTGAPACTVTPGASGAASVRCPASALTGGTGTVTVTATARSAGRTLAAGSTQVSLVKAPAPRATLTVTARSARAMRVVATATGKAPFGYAWLAGSCTVSSPAASSTTVTCPERTPSRVVVTARATQADGQLVRASVTLVTTAERVRVARR